MLLGATVADGSFAGIVVLSFFVTESGVLLAAVDGLLLVAPVPRAPTVDGARAAAVPVGDTPLRTGTGIPR